VTEIATRKLGAAGPEVAALGLGCMGMSGAYGPAPRGESIATIHAALDAGVDLLDTGDFYGMGHNEMLIAEALAEHRERAKLSVKYGAQRGPTGAPMGFDASPAATKTSLAYSLKRLGTHYVDVYRSARLDPSVPIEETVGAIAELVEDGYVLHIGLSEVGAETIRRAHATHPICDLQIEYSLISRGIEAEILPTCRELGIAITAYGVLSRGLISGRFADERRASVAQVAIAWALARGDDIVPLLGARSPERLAEGLGALEVELSAEDLEAIERAVPADAAAGDRYNAHGMAMLDSEA